LFERFEVSLAMKIKALLLRVVKMEAASTSETSLSYYITT
jgi:hypothetical protein